MATERTPVDGLIEQDPEEAKDVSITVENPESVAIETEDGGMLIDFDPESKDNINAPAGTLFVRGLQVYTSTTAATGANSFLEKKDISFLREYDAAETTTGTPKYYAMSGGATGAGAASSGKITIVPTPSSAFMYKLHYNARPLGLSSTNTTTFLSLNFGNGLLYACLVEAFSYLKGPMDMLQLYEQKYQTEIQKFGGEQIGRRRRDDYTDGEPRIPVQSPTP